MLSGFEYGEQDWLLWTDTIKKGRLAGTFETASSLLA